MYLDILLFITELKKELLEKGESLYKEGSIKNEELKRENLKLKNYIERTFEVVKNLFNFPIDRFKRLVNNFVEYFEK